MKIIFFLAAFIMGGCNNSCQQNKISALPDSSITRTDSLIKGNTEDPPAPSPAAKIYSNERFKEVSVKKTGEHSFLIQGKAQIFEASFSWVVEDGHEELKKGFEMTDAGAPEWGNFSFTINIQKKRTNSTLILLLFESSAKDGSRQYELPVVLY